MRLAKITLTVLFAAAVICAAAVLPSRLCFAEGKSYAFYCGTSSADCREYAVTGGAALYRLTLKNVCGEATVYDGLVLDEFLDAVGGEIVFCEELSDSVNYYCSAPLPYSVNLYGKEINLHICVRKDGVKVASPIIFGGY